MASKNQDVAIAKRIFEITLVMFAVVFIALSVLIVIDAPLGVGTGFAVADITKLTGSEGSDDAAYYSFLMTQQGAIDDRVFREYDRFTRFEDFLNFVYASEDMGQMEIVPLDITESEFYSRRFNERYSPIVGPFNNMVMTAREVAAGNRAAEERFLIELYSFGLYIDGLTSGTYWRASELPCFEGLGEVKEKYGEKVYEDVLKEAYGLLLLSDQNMPPYEEWV